MTTRETTLGELTAADLGKRVTVPARFITPAVGRVLQVSHSLAITRVIVGTEHYQFDIEDDHDTRVTVHNEEET